jgi:branched-chain amino acid aminotransferase
VADTLYFCYVKKTLVMNECFGNKFILNGKLLPAESFDNSLVYDGESVYEVIRMVKGNPVFFTDHMERLVISVRLQGKKLLADVQKLRSSILALAQSEKNKETNLKIVFNYNNGDENWLIYLIEPIYPTEEQYKMGVKGVLFFAERKDPESKVINHKLRSSIYHKLILEGAYEALLVDKKNCITEGSRSNIFFLKGETLVTAPEKVILNGITRIHILDICRENKINVKLTCIKYDRISEFDAVFMTGTSPMVLPFYCIDDVSFNVRLPLMEKLRQLYMIKAEESLHRFRTDL